MRHISVYNGEKSTKPSKYRKFSSALFKAKISWRCIIKSCSLVKTIMKCTIVIERKVCSNEWFRPKWDSVWFFFWWFLYINDRWWRPFWKLLFQEMWHLKITTQQMLGSMLVTSDWYNWHSFILWGYQQISHYLSC